MYIVFFINVNSPLSDDVPIVSGNEANDTSPFSFPSLVFAVIGQFCQI